MRKAFLLSLAALPLLAFDCGGPDPEPAYDPFGCTISVRGAVSEDLWCIATVFDYSAMPPGYSTDMFVVEFAAYRGSLEAMDVAGGGGFFLPARAVTGVTYGWNSADGSTNVNSGGLIYEDASWEITHEATAPLSELDYGTGAFSATLSRIPAASAVNEELLGVDGTATATLESTTGGAPVTFTIRF